MKIALHFGALSDQLRVQLREQGVAVPNVHRFQRMADAITLLAVQGLLSDARVVAARRALLRRIVQAAYQKKPTKPAPAASEPEQGT